MPELYVNGAWVSASAGGRRTIRCPADGSLVAEIDEAGPDDARAAVGAAYDAFHYGSVADDLRPRARRPAAAGGRPPRARRRRGGAAPSRCDTGKRLVESEYDVADVVSVFRHYGGIAAENAGRVVDTGREDVLSRVVHEPLGVCALIAPWNYPLLQASWKVAPCLAAGNTFVLKPSELTPHTSIILMRLLEEAGLPAGVGNLVLGAGADAAAPLVEDPRVDLVSFTGGLVTGRRVMASAAATVKKVALELGGKNPNIVFADADLEVALDFALTAVFLHSGQVCSAGARLLVEESIHDDFVDRLVERAGSIRLGGPHDPKAETGAPHQRGAPRQGGGVRRRRRRRGCRAALRWLGARGSRPRAGLLLPAHRARRLHERHDGHPGRVVRPGPDRGDVHAARTRPSRPPTTASTGWPARCGPRTPARPSGSPTGCGWARSGSTTTTRTSRRPSGAATSSRASGRELGEAGLDEYRETKHVWHNLRPAVQHWFED